MSLNNPVRNLIFHWGNWLLYAPLSVLCIAVIMAVFALQYTANNLSVNTDTTDLIAPDAPFQQNRRKFEKAFPQDTHALLLVVESSTPELTKAAGKRLQRLLSADITHFTKVYNPDDNAFFHQNGLLYLDSDELQSLSNTLSQAQPFIGRISQEPSLNGFFSIFTDALDSANGPQELPIDLTSLITKVTNNLHKTVNDDKDLLSWQELIAEKTLSMGPKDKTFIFVLPKLDFSQMQPAENAIGAVRQAVAKIQDPNLPAVKVWITGEIGLEHDELTGISEGTFAASLFSVGLVCLILMIAYRSFLLTLATLLTITLGMIFSGLFAAFAVKQLNLISVAFAVSNIGLGVEYAIHFCLRYRDNLSVHRDRNQAIRAALMATSPSLILCAGTTSIGLYSFIPTDYQGISELGLLAGTSLFICLFVTLTALPALLKLLPVSPANESVPDFPGAAKIPEALATFTLHNAKPISIMTGILAVIAVILVIEVKTDFNPINLRDPGTESVIAFKDLMKDKDTTPMTLTVLAEDEATAKKYQQQLAVLNSVDKTVSLFDFLPSEQEDKLASIEEMNLMMGSVAQGFPRLNYDRDPTAEIHRLIKAIDSSLTKKTDALEIAAFQAFKQELNSILLELDTRQEPSRQQYLAKIQTSLLGTLPIVMNELINNFSAQEITLAGIPADIKERWLSKDGLYRIQIFPKKDLNDLANLKQFITDVQQVAPDATDLPVMYLESMKAVIDAFQEAIMIALVAIAMLLFFIRRNLIDTLLVMTPLVLAGLFTMASTVITETPINFANIIALPLLLGLGVDNGIHMVEKLRHSLSEEQNIYQSSTARGMFYGALTTISSFAGLAFSPHEGIASMGLVITIGIFWIMTCTFIILPALSKLVLKDEIQAAHH